MSLAAKASDHISMEDYLVLENASRYKHEYMAGVIYAIQGEPSTGMAGGSQAHSRLIRNAGYALHGKLRGSPCEVLQSEMRLRIDAVDSVFYPDVLVHCQPNADPVATLELNQARLVIEVLSPSTQTFDMSVKLNAYQKLDGMQHILLISSLEQAAWSCERVPAEGAWTRLRAWPRGSTLALPGLGLELSWDEVYGGVGLA